MPLLTARSLWLLALAAVWLIAAGWVPEYEGLFPLHLVLVIGLIAFDALRIRHALQGLTIERDLPAQLGLGEEETLRYRWVRTGRLPLQLELKESGVEPAPTFTPWPLSWRTATDPMGTVALHMTPLRRGPLAFPEIRLRAQSSLGLISWQHAVKHRDVATVVPGLRALQDLRLWARREEIVLGGARIARHEEGTYFKELRPYTTGDSMRSIDWKASARRGSLIVRELEPERSQSLMLVLDTGRAMRVPVEGIMRLDAALAAALALGWVAVQRGDLIGAAAFGDKLHTFMPPRSGAGQMKLLLDQLGALQAEPVEPDYLGLCATLASLVRKRTLIVFFTEVSGTNVSQDLLTGIRLLARRHLPVIVTLPDARIEALLDVEPKTVDALYQQAAAAQVVTERASALQAISEAGGIVVDVPPSRLNAAVVNTYIGIKARGRL